MPPGIYLVEGDTCPTQIVVSEELSAEDNFWLTNLRNDLTEEQLVRVFTTAEGKPGVGAYVYAIGDANAETLEDLYMHRKKGVILTEKLDAYFTEKYGASYFSKGKVEGEARGKARGKAEAVLTFLRARFKRVPKDVEEAVLAVTDPIALESWAAQAATCDTLDEFAEALR